MQMTSWLLAAYNKTAEPLFLDAYTELCALHRYDLNVVNQKITQPSDDNYSDDELAHLPYFTYLWSQRSDLDHFFFRSVQRAHRILRTEKSSLWNLIYAVTYSRAQAHPRTHTYTQAGPGTSARANGGVDMGMDMGMGMGMGDMQIDPALLEDVGWTLRGWPLEQIQWPIDNSARVDQLRNPDLTRSGTLQSLRLFPYDENSMFRWNGNPFEYGGGAGTTEYDPSAW
jgi:hypothetical protein